MGGAAPQQQAAGSVVPQGLPTAHRQPPAASQAVQVDQHPTGGAAPQHLAVGGGLSTRSSTIARGRSRTTFTIWSRSSPSATCPSRRLCRRRGGGHGQGPSGHGSADARRSIWDPFDGPGPDSCCTWQVDGGSLGGGRSSCCWASTRRGRRIRIDSARCLLGPSVVGRSGSPVGSQS